jgi:putative membrane protein
MNIILKLVISTIAVLVADLLLRGVHAMDLVTALSVAVVLALLNTFLKPLLILLTLPVTLITLGLFILVINALLVQLAAYLIDSFQVENFWWALLFSVIMWAVQSVLQSFDRPKNDPPDRGNRGWERIDR